MTIDQEQVKKALDDFENDNYVDSKETLRKEVKQKVNDYLKTNLDMNDDPIDDLENDNNEEEEDDGLPYWQVVNYLWVVLYNGTVE